ncbi:MAG: dihydrofolate reductase, partial [Bacteroidales bacterium]|nr:dihydrofolate reductase [Bacteroidales bacterium]
MKMKKIVKMLSIATMIAAAAGCAKKDENFKYLIDEFADIQVIRYQIPGWNDLTLKQKEYVYHLSEAAKWGRDIIWDQNCKCNLEIRHAIEAIIKTKGEGDGSQEWNDFLVYAKRVFFANGIHHHYAENKILPQCSREY